MTSAQVQRQSDRINGLIIAEGPQIHAQLVTILPGGRPRCICAAVIEFGDGPEAVMMAVPIIHADHWTTRADLAALIVDELAADTATAAALADLARLLFTRGAVTSCTIQAAAAWIVIAAMPAITDSIKGIAQKASLEQ